MANNDQSIGYCFSKLTTLAIIILGNERVVGFSFCHAAFIRSIARSTKRSLSFLKAVQPKYLLISAGYKSLFGHRHPISLQRYQEIGALWWNTADRGALMLSEKASDWDIQSWRDENGKYWNNKHK
jgi:hypothetical protein